MLSSLTNQKYLTASINFVKPNFTTKIKVIKLKSIINVLKPKKKKPTVLSNNLIATCIRIKFVTNNIFCTIWSISGKRTFRVHSAGMRKIQISKKKLFFYSHIVIQFFFKELRRWRKKYKQKDAKLFYSLQIPKKYRKYILKGIFLNSSAIQIEYKKPFNGCKPRKKRRKKRLGFRSFK